jgi:uncharacterized membrane protein YhhN
MNKNNQIIRNFLTVFLKFQKSNDMKNWIQKYGVVVYILLLSVHLYTQLFDVTSLQTITKLLLLPLLILVVMTQEVPTIYVKEKMLVILALLFSWIGDALLTFDHLFIPGMIAFLLTHVFNIIYFNKVQSLNSKKNIRYFLVTIVLIVFCGLVYYRLKDTLGALVVPIVIYMIVIAFSCMMTVNASLNQKTTMIAKLFWTPGMYFFIASDTVLAFNKFIWSVQTPKPHIGLVTMATYGIAQLLLVKGSQLYFAKKD